MSRSIVRWENGREEVFDAYCRIGYSSFVKAGLKRGKVYENDKEVFINEDGFVEQKT